MKSKSYSVYFLAIGYIIFIFAVISPPAERDAISVAYSLAVSFALNILLGLIIFGKGETKPLANLAALLYILYLMSRLLYLVCMYMKTYYGQTSGLSVFIPTVITVIYLTLFSKDGRGGISVTLGIISVLFIAVLFAVNFSYFKPINLYPISKTRFFDKNYITMFDYVIPVYLALNKEDRKRLSEFFVFSVLSAFVTILIAVFAYGCIQGNYLYGLSPLQIIFGITRGKLVKNYDPVCNLFLSFAYFSAVSLVCRGYKNIKKDFIYFNGFDLLLCVPGLYFVSATDNIRNFFICISIRLVLIFGRKRKTA